MAPWPEFIVLVLGAEAFHEGQRGPVLLGLLRNTTVGSLDSGGDDVASYFSTDLAGGTFLAPVAEVVTTTDAQRTGEAWGIANTTSISTMGGTVNGEQIANCLSSHAY